ncbi:MAG: DNA mismatch repair endonuclease MutL [Candidatus Eremiobacteraeota bacterium]|nr:DNA mismatch repair endonuclease MutL [Candidatus Eremiobacteraeota bacterium]
MIRLLDAETIGQIAAGEVIERPVSVVKELVENALDAGATRIAVRIRDGGLREIEVADDGGGIAPEDLPLALRRHATSKLDGAGGLSRIRTLGFRGEGLASIAAVARVTLASRTAAYDVASAVDAHGDEIGEVHPLAGPRGTRAIVRDLFANVPVRRGYLRTPAAESARVAHWLATLALAYPAVGFTLEQDGRTTFAFPPGDDPAPRLRHVFGPTAPAMLAVDGSGDHAAVGGWVSAPGDDRPDRRAQMLFVNGRLLHSTLVSGAWSAAYRTFAMSGRHPFGVLHVDVPPSEVDPNVHPTKSDVRLRYADGVVSVVKEAIADALRRSAAARFRRAVSLAPVPDDLAATTPPRPVALHVANGARTSQASAPDEHQVLRVLAQVDLTYILATDDVAVVLVDQHAAHERIVFEQLAANAASAAPAEPLLIPHLFELRPDEAERLDATLEALARGGLHVERFGDLAYRITATPAGLVHAGRSRPFDVDDFLATLADEVRGLDANGRVWASLACHAVVRAGERLEYPEMTALVERLQRCANPMHCPHGRPTIVRLEAEQIARLFKRA